uniref:DNA primase large subunit PriL n=1 Tax=Staphylothermus marinus TaxID=2280 RepID=A0A7C4DA71_STAMA
MINYIFYPFLASLDNVLRRYPGLSLEYLLESGSSTVRENALAILESIVSGEKILEFEASSEDYVLIYYSILVGVKAIGDKKLMHRIALTYSKRAREKLDKESVENLITISKALGLDVRFLSESVKIPLKIVKSDVVFIEKPFAIPLKTYLKIVAGRLSQDPKYSLVNQVVSNGLVYVDRGVLIRILEERIYRFIMDSFEKIDFDTAKVTGFVNEIKRILDKYGWYKASVDLEFKTSYFVKDALPPCINRLIERLLGGENLSHHERFAVASFLVSIGLGVEQVLEFFKHTPDFKEKIARYQIEHIAGLRGSRKKYLPYNCETMKSLGLCSIAEYCYTNVKNPLSVYKLNLKRIKSGSGNGEGEVNKHSI